MKKTVVLAGLSLLALLIVLPVTCSVKQTASNPSPDNPALRADGTPLPVPHNSQAFASSASSLLADGTPLPVPHSPQAFASSTSSLLADVSPLLAPIPLGNGPHVALS